MQQEITRTCRTIAMAVLAGALIGPSLATAQQPHPAAVGDLMTALVQPRHIKLVFRLNHTIQQQGAVGWVEHTRNPSEQPQEMGFAALNPSYRGLLQGYYKATGVNHLNGSTH